MLCGAMQTARVDSPYRIVSRHPSSMSPARVRGSPMVPLDRLSEEEGQGEFWIFEITLLSSIKDMKHLGKWYGDDIHLFRMMFLYILQCDMTRTSTPLPKTLIHSIPNESHPNLDALNKMAEINKPPRIPDQCGRLPGKGTFDIVRNFAIWI